MSQQFNVVIYKTFVSFSLSVVTVVGKDEPTFWSINRVNEDKSIKLLLSRFWFGLKCFQSPAFSF